MAGTRVRIGGLTFEGGAGDEGFFITEDGLTGWDDSVEVRRPRAELELAHGDYDLPGFRGSRVVTISGSCHTKSPEQQDHFKHRLNGLLADSNDKGRLTVDHQGSTLWMDVRLASDPKFAIELYGLIAKYQISFYSANPRKYGDTNEFETPNGVVQVTHYGSFPADPVCTVSGTFSEPYVIEGPGGRYFKVTANVTPGHPHRIDMRTGMLWQDGFRVQGGIEIADTFAIPGGRFSPITFNPNGGSGLLHIDLLDTYM